MNHYKQCRKCHSLDVAVDGYAYGSAFYRCNTCGTVGTHDGFSDADDKVSDTARDFIKVLHNSNWEDCGEMQCCATMQYFHPVQYCVLRPDIYVFRFSLFGHWQYTFINASSLDEAISKYVNTASPKDVSTADV